MNVSIGKSRLLPFISLGTISLLVCGLGCNAAADIPRSDRGESPAPTQSPSAGRVGLGTGLAVSKTKTASAAATRAEELPASVPRFADVHEQVGIHFTYQNGTTGKALMVEATGGGAGWLDYDRDGNWDLFAVQAGNPTWTTPEENPGDELFRQDTRGQFQPVARLAGFHEHQYGQGIAIADYDEDGFADVYITNVGDNTLLKNQGDGTFVEVTGQAGVNDPRWSSSAGWGDLNRDGLLDLFVCNYLVYDPYHPYPCKDAEGKPATCHPEELNPVPNVCFQSRGDGTFEEVSSQWGLVGDGSKSLGVVIADLNADTVPDIYVANDTTANFLYLGTGNGFEERGITMGCALSGDGMFQASMGIACGDFDGNLHPDLYVTHFSTDFNTLYRNLDGQGFQDASQQTGLVQPTWNYLGFGTVMADFDRDGMQDLFIANGHISDERKKGNEFHMRPQIFSFAGRKWREQTDAAGPYFQEKYLGRAVASCDFDQDGDLDLAVVHQNQPLALLRNETDSGHWLKVRFLGTHSNREGWLTTVTLRQNEKVFKQQLAGGTSYCAAHEPMLLFALPTSDPVQLEIEWPSGKRQRREEVAVNGVVRLLESEP